MCGIAGFFSTDELNEEQTEAVHKVATKLFVETQSRGTDASGFSYINDHSEMVTVKGPVAAENLVKDKKWTKLKDSMPQSLIMHCRSMTSGSPLDNFNNHPVVVDKEVAVIHNGTISNADAVKSAYGLNEKAKGEVDSEVIPLLIKHNLDMLAKDKGVNPLKVAKAINMSSQEFSGGFACALMNASTPNCLYLFNHTNPIVLVYSESLKTAFFASTEDIMRKAFEYKGNIEVRQKYFAGRKHDFIGQKLSAETISILKLDGFLPKKRRPEGYEAKYDLGIDFFKLSYEGSNSFGVRTLNMETKGGNRDRVKITRSLEAKDGFDGILDDVQDMEDWQRAGASCMG